MSLLDKILILKITDPSLGPRWRFYHSETRSRVTESKTYTRTIVLIWDRAPQYNV